VKAAKEAGMDLLYLAQEDNDAFLGIGIIGWIIIIVVVLAVLYFFSRGRGRR
jgi:hypothetical protein